MRSIRERTLDRIEKVTEDAFEWLEVNARRVVKRSVRRPGAQRARSTASVDPHRRPSPGA